jgi:DNA-binding CsgD family transcriptional regulator/uncharacterized protein YciI
VSYLAERVLAVPAAACPREWAAHLEFLSGLERRGLLLAGGPLADGRTEALVLAVRDEAAAHRALRADPLAAARLIARSRIRAWTVRYGDPAFTGRDVPRAEPAPAQSVLTSHEARIARMVVEGYTNQRIADRLGVTCRAVEQHLTRVYRKLDIRRRAQLAEALRQAAGPVPAPAPAMPAPRLNQDSATSYQYPLMHRQPARNGLPAAAPNPANAQLGRGPIRPSVAAPAAYATP